MAGNISLFKRSALGISGVQTPSRPLGFILQAIRFFFFLIRSVCIRSKTPSTLSLGYSAGLLMRWTFRGYVDTLKIFLTFFTVFSRLAPAFGFDIFCLLLATPLKIDFLDVAFSFFASFMFQLNNNQNTTQ